MSIRKRGKAWEIVIEMGKDADGIRIQKTFTFHGRKEDARAEEARLKHEARYGNFMPDNKQTVGQYLDKWLAWKKPDLAYNTFRSYEQIIDGHLRKEIGHVPLLKLTPLKLQEYYNKQVAKGDLSNASINYHHRMLRSAFNQAMKWRILRDNPCFGAVPPSPDKYKPVILSDAQLINVFRELKGTIIYISVILSILTGMRRGETCGLRWQDIDFVNRSIRVQHALKRKKGEGLIMEDTKTGKDRMVPVSALLLYDLEQQLAWIKDCKETYSETYIDSDYVVCWTTGLPVDPDYVTKKYNKILNKLKLPLDTRFHDLRHAHATMMLEDGADLKDISDELGHSSISITSDIYLNSSVENRRSHVDNIDKRFLPKKKNENKSEQNVSINNESDKK